MAENQLDGDNLKNLAGYKNLKSLNFAENNVTSFDQVKAIVSHFNWQEGLTELESLNLSGNPVAELDDFKEKMFGMFSKLEVRI